MLEDLAGTHRTTYNTYGVLYNWPAATEACPPGTHLPTDEEWYSLESFFATGECDPERVENFNEEYQCFPTGKAIKSKTGWTGNNGDGSSGFNAPPGTYISENHFNSIGANALFWTSSVNINDLSCAWRRRLRYLTQGINRNAEDKSYGLSVRCVQ